jgi:hypothetical protein
VGKRLSKQLTEAVHDEFGLGSATAYDIAIAFLTLPERLIGDDISPRVKENIASAVFRAPFVDFEEKRKVYLGVA